MYWEPYVPVAVRRQKNMKKLNQMQKKGKILQPIQIEGRTIAKKFWGKLWCGHIESFSDYENRLPRGKTYARNGSVSHLEVKKGIIEALVSGTYLYEVIINVKELSSQTWEYIKKQSFGQIGSILELLKGQISDNIMKIVADKNKGLFPKTNEIDFTCSCPDSAYMCKHIAAVFYGFANLLDTRPELLFVLRDVDVNELINTNIDASIATQVPSLEGDISQIFDIELDSQADESQKLLSSGNKKNAKKTFAVYGHQIKNLRSRMSLSVSDFSKIIGKSSNTIYKWEKSKDILKLKKQTKTILKKLMKANLETKPFSKKSAI